MIQTDSLSATLSRLRQELMNAVDRHGRLFVPQHQPVCPDSPIMTRCKF